MIWPIARFCLAVPALVVIALQQSQVWRDPEPQWKVLPFLAIASVGAVEPLINGVRERWAQNRVYRHSELVEILGECLARLEELTSIPCSRMGMSAYRLGRARPRSKRRLHRVVRLRLSPRPITTCAWVVGKGVIGACAEKRDDITVNVYDSQGIIADENEWLQAPIESTLGMDWIEAFPLRGRHGVIVATPLYAPRSTRIIGVLSVDGPVHGSSALDSGPVRDALHQTAASVAKVLK
jgi:hypothetical protein